MRPYTTLADSQRLSHGCGAIVLKRHADAERDGDRIYALIAGMGVSANQVQALHLAYAQCDIDPASISLVEGGGASSPSGDAEEIAALHEVFGKSGFPEVALGAASPVTGAAGQAAAVAGLIKAALAIHHRALPPTLGAEQPHHDLQASRLYIHPRLRPWISLANAPRRAGVTMTGPSGSYAHFVLEEHAAASREAWRSLTPCKSELIVIAAATREALQEEIRLLHQLVALGRTEINLADLAFTLVSRFSDRHTFRLTLVARTVSDLADRLAAVDQRLRNDTVDGWKNYFGTYFGSVHYTGKVGFLFPGVGFPGLAGGYADRLGDLALYFPDVLDWLDRAETACAGDEVGYKLSFQLFPPPYSDIAVLAEIEEQLKWSQRASTGTMIANLATYSLVRALGIRADVMTGFSLGEWSALVAAGIIDMETAASTSQAPEQSSALVQTTEPYRGTWAMVSASADEIEAVIQPLGDEVAVTIDVSPDQAFIGGEEVAVGIAIERLREAGIWASAIPSSPLMASFSAFHTKNAAPYAEQLTRTLSAMPLKRLDCDIYSSVTGRLFPPDPKDIVKILGKNVTDAVRVRETITAMHKQGIRIFLQLGGGGRLLPTVQKNLALEPHVALSIDVEYLPGLEQLQYVLAQLLALGVSLNPMSLYTHRVLKRLDLDSQFRLPESPPVGRDELASAVSLPVLTWLKAVFEGERKADQAFSALLAKVLGQPRPRSPGAPVRSEAQPLPPFPLRGEVVEIEPGRRLRSRLVLDLGEHHFLNEHVLLAMPGTLKPARDLLPTLPFAFGIEILAQAAQALVPGRSVLDCHDVEALRWISLQGSDTLVLTVTADRATDTDVQVEIHIEGNAKPAMRGHVAMGSLPPPPPPMPFQCETECPLSATDYYERGPLFQGPLFRAITSLRALSPQAMSGEIVLRDPARLVTSDHLAPIFDPILIDSAAQMLGVPTWIKDQRFLVPIRAKRISRFGALPPPGTGAEVRINHRRLDERRVAGDFDVVGPDAEVLLRIEGWQEIWVLWPQCLLERNHRPKEGVVSRAWDAGDAMLACCRAGRNDLGDVDPGWIARYYLTRAELQDYSDAADVRWLLGRLAAKDCVRAWFQRHRGVVLHPVEVELSDLPGGKIMLLSPRDGPSSIAVTHLANEAVAVASNMAAVEIGMASMTRGEGGLQNTTLSRQEMACLPQTEPERTIWASRAWCAKQASAKAAGQGTAALSRFSVRQVHPKNGTVEILDELRGMVVQVATTIEGDRVTALSIAHPLAEPAQACP